MNGSRRMQLLVVEDNPAEVRLIQEALAESGVSMTIEAVPDGIEAVEYLRRSGKYSKKKRPDLVLLDLKMPRKSGREVLAEMKSDPELRVVPVVVLTASRSPEDVATAYDLNANSLIQKPADLDGFVEVIRTIHKFWLGIAKLPPQTQA